MASHVNRTRHKGNRQGDGAVGGFGPLQRRKHGKMNYSVSLSKERVRVPMPQAPRSIAETGLTKSFLVDLLIKTVYRRNIELPSQMSAELRLSPVIIEELIAEASQKQLLHLLGQPGADMSAEMRYQLTIQGRSWAQQALEASSWTGAAPVPVEAFTQQIQAQTVGLETLTEATLRGVFDGLTLSHEVMHRIGPAINSGQSILLYGPPGNGKSSIAGALCRAFDSHVYIPHALSVGGNVIVFFDPAVHTPVRVETQATGGGLRRGHGLDQRYVPCVRPHVITGGELTLDKLDLKRNPRTELYDAPLQLKATGGIFVVDDFGRQRHEPQELINRLIVPLESRIEHLVLENGRKIEVPFDTLVIFSTNFDPRSIMDEAGLRRLRHKILVDRPDRKMFVKILARTTRKAGLTLDEEVLAYILFDLYGRSPTARFNAFHPQFLVDQCRSICAYRNIPPQMTPEVLDQAWQNLMAAH